MPTPNMLEAQYLQGESVQGAFKYGTHQNISVSATSAASTALNASVVLLSASDYFYLNIDAAATTASMLLPPGMTALIVDQGNVLHFLQYSGATVVSIIDPQ